MFCVYLVRLKALITQLESSMPGSTFANVQPGGLGYPLWARKIPCSLCSSFGLFVHHFLVDPSTYIPTLQFNDLTLDVTANYQPLSPWGFGFSLHDAFNISPILSNTGTGTVAASFPDAPSVGAPPGALDVSIRSTATATGDEILCHPLPIHDTLWNDPPIRRYATRRVNVNAAHSQPSLRARFDDVMKIVRQLPPGHKPSNTHFTPFFTRIEDRYVCLLCPKALCNRTQMIQHIAGGHGGNRPFKCSFW